MIRLWDGGKDAISCLLACAASITLQFSLALSLSLTSFVMGVDL